MSQFGSGDVYQQARLLGGTLGITYKISPSGSSAQITTLIPATSVVRVVSSASVNIKFSDAATVTATTADAFLPANRPEFFCVGETDQRFAAIGTADVYISIIGKVIYGPRAAVTTGPNSFA